MNVYSIVFSPTGGTEKVAQIVADAWSEAPVKIDLSDPKANFSAVSLSKDDLALIAMPSFGGRAPAVAIERLKKIHGCGARCALACVYGNRAYEDTLAEMAAAAKSCGFQVVAGIAAVAEHSIMPQYATGRPDSNDRRQLEQFARQIVERTKPASTIPGTCPDKKAGGMGLVPKAGKECVKCGLCANTCPVQAIDPGTFASDSKKCIACMRCVKNCPQKTRKVSGALVSVAALAIKKACSVRKENELYL